MLEFIKKNKTNPFIQLMLILMLMLIFMIITKATSTIDLDRDYTSTGPWEVMASFILFYTLVNCVFSLQAPVLQIYFRNSIFAFIGLMIGGGLMSYAFSGIGLEEAGSIKWILLVFSIGYLIFLSIVNLMRFIVEIAQKQDKALRGEE